MSILINDLLNIQNPARVKFRFNQSNGIENPLEIFKNDRKRLIEWQFWNYASKRSFYEGDIAVGFVKVEGNKWLLFDVSIVTKDLNRFNAVGYEFETVKEYEKFFGRIIIEFKNNSQNMVRLANSVINDCKVLQILEDTFHSDVFPGYENINLSWYDLKRVIDKSVWKTALENQKGVYLITDKNTGKMYVGSAYGSNMLHGRWSSYVQCGHGGNVELKNFDFDYIKDNFHYSILDIYKSTIDDNVILKRESWWKITLLTRKFGYNKN